MKSKPVSLKKENNQKSWLSSWFGGMCCANDNDTSNGPEGFTDIRR